MQPVILAALAAFAFTTVPAAAAPRTAEGTILSFECGDNCYLTIRAGSKKLTGLCSAPQCEKWNENTEMPRSFVGRKVKVTIEQGDQLDGSGNVAGQTDAFTSITFR